MSLATTLLKADLATFYKLVTGTHFRLVIYKKLLQSVLIEFVDFLPSCYYLMIS